MREILFRGKRIDNGEWEIGYYVCFITGSGKVSHRIYSSYAESDCRDWEVDPETVEEYTGLIDKNGKKIFEGDIIRSKDYHGDRWGTVDYFAGTYYLGGADGYSDEYIFNESDKEVIGNKWDNPELLEGRNDD